MRDLEKVAPGRRVKRFAVKIKVDQVSLRHEYAREKIIARLSRFEGTKRAMGAV